MCVCMHVCIYSSIVSQTFTLSQSSASLPKPENFRGKNYEKYIRRGDFTSTGKYMARGGLISTGKNMARGGLISTGNIARVFELG